MNSYGLGQPVKITIRTGINPTDLAAPAAAGATTITLRSASGYADTNVLRIDAGLPTEERATISGSPTAAGVVTLTAGLRFAHSRGAEVDEPTTPTAGNLYLTDPAGTVTPVALGSLTTEATGELSYTFTPGTAGRTRYRFVSTETVATGEASEFSVESA